MIEESKMFDGDLYHYTTIEKLALILENQTIRFNSLMNVDDPREGDTLDWGRIGHHILISCWTSANSENIAMWKMYSDLKCGCIIKMNAMMFQGSGLNITKENPSQVLFENDIVKICTPLMPLIEVEYEELYKKKKFHKVDEVGDIFLDNLSVIKYKSKEWEFQKEYRFVLYQMIKPTCDWGFLDDELPNKVTEVDSYSMNYYDLPIDAAHFNQMEIITSPSITDGYRKILEKIARKDMKISESKCLIRETLS